MVSLSAAKTVLFTVCPFVIPRVISWYRTAKVKTESQHVPIQALPSALHKSLNILFIAAVLGLITTLPFFSPENILDLTNSRIQTANDVIFTRLAALRGPEGLTEADERLRPKIASIDARCLFLTYGPDVLTNCPFCVSDEPLSYFYYALPSILIPYGLNLVALGLATSFSTAGQAASRWRIFAVSAGLTIAICECVLTAGFDWKSNARAWRPEEYVLYHWRMRLFRGLSICLIDVAVAGCIYLAGTNRIFVTPPSVAERTETALKLLDQARGRMNALGIVRNAVVRDEGLRKRTEAYWIREGKIMGEIMDEREVVEGVRSALAGRVQVSRIEEEAKQFAEGLTAWPHQVVAASGSA